ncbi:MAG: hypothetical protein A2W93_15425 [Bacteroidetes bacterium GWF2_43_63]|nr:MAG: hypothetical protein A2W94_05195 [Bacteroidetes bacterium GWE2_42_42]OFY53412.1 MAG: hypothetical protein A2W93_15425 [Bacteroidetes bacterium GWF2_43_63]
MINDRANRQLDSDKRAALFDLFAKGRIFMYIALAGIVVIFVVSLKYELLDPMATFLIYAALLFVYVIVTNYIAWKRLKSNDYPASYIRSYIISSVIRIVGIVVFLALMMI